MDIVIRKYLEDIPPHSNMADSGQSGLTPAQKAFTELLAPIGAGIDRFVLFAILQQPVSVEESHVTQLFLQLHDVFRASTLALE